MADFSFLYDNTRGYSDWQIVDGDFVLADDLQTAVEMALFTDRRATDNEMRRVQEGTTRVSRRGYWANSFKDYTQGSALWTLEGANRSQETLDDAVKFSKQCLEFLVTEGVAVSVDAQASFSNEQLILNVQINKPDGQAPFAYEFAWAPWEG